MRIAIATDWFPPRQGGIESQLATLAERLAERGHQVTVITSTPGATNGARFAVRRIDGLRLPMAHVAISPMLPGRLRRAIGDDFDLVHAHVSVVSPIGYLSAFAAASQGIPTVVTFHSILKLKRLVLAVGNAAAGLDQRPIVWSAVSQLVAQQVRDALRSVNVAVLPNGIDLNFWRDPPSTRATEPESITFVTAMRMHRKKRPRQLVAAFARAVTECGVPARLVMAGAGPELRAVQADAAVMQRSHDASVAFPGWQDRASLRDLYRRAHAFVLPTRHEAFGIAALEARATGLPVIAWRTAGCREFLQHDHNALLCDSDAEFVAAMARLIREPRLRHRLAIVERTLERYDWDAVLGEHERVYQLATQRNARALDSATAPA